ncbi:CLUMA_CG004532, isoform A [Clunio marinus]|uniref:Odorant receptor n=1 Tax=Clunio marinus TaxID=568069 RepID=A0A1J1HTF3_9DIPT|nr:CLUMA_CG004532, isoform A [Clunio marinus]
MNTENYLICFKLPILILKTFGFWKEEPWSKLRWMYSILIRYLFLDCIVIAYSVHLIKSLGIRSIADISTTLSYLLTIYGLFFKSMWIIIKQKKIRSMMKSLEELLKVTSFGKTNERNLMQHENNRMMKVERIFYGSSIVLAFFVLIKAIAFDSRIGKIPLDTWIFFNMEPNSFLYWLVVAQECFATLFVIIVNFSLDMIQIVFMHYLTVMLKELSIEIESIQPEDDTKDYDRFCKCVDCFVQLKDLGGEISTHLSLTFFVQAILSSVILCTSAFLLSTLSFTNEMPIIIRTVIYGISMMIQIFLPCYYGNELTLISNKISTTLFHSKWLDGSKKYKKAVTIFMENAKRSINISAFGFVFVDIGTLTTILNSTYSLYALVSKLNTK